jgi:hypothetical protein
MRAAWQPRRVPTSQCESGVKKKKKTQNDRLEKSYTPATTI